MAAFGATITIAIAALVALKQIWLARLQLQIASEAIVIAKEDIKIRSRREAIALAAKHCEDFADETLQKLNNWIEEFRVKKISLTRWELVNKAFDDTSPKNPNASQAWVQQVRTQLEPSKWVTLPANSATGAADEEVAFPVVGTIFCETVQIFAPWLIAMRTHKDASFTSGKYANTVRLYEIWADRIRMEEIEAQAKMTEKELSSLKKDKIKPIGT
jgi:hypothetical protein